ncbi:iron-siderophore ABC transporter substrate-binding protein [soil metagenome]
MLRMVFRILGDSKSLFDRRSVLGLSAALAGGLLLPELNRASAQESTPESGTRLIQHVMGETEVPANPQRVVVLDGPQLDAAIALGIKPVGAVPAQSGPLPAYLGTAVEGIEIVGTISEPDLEKIVGLNPDLILGSKFRHEDIYPQLSAIAPTVFSDLVGTFWKEDFTLFANAFGKTDEGAAISAAYTERATTLGSDLNAAVPGLTVSVIRFRADDVRIYFKTSFIGTVLIDLALARPESQNRDDERFEAISMERIKDVDASVIFITSYGDPSETDLAQYVDDPLWQGLSAVQNGQVYWVNDETWMVAIGYLAAGMVLDDIEGFLLNGVPATPVPVA